MIRLSQALARLKFSNVVDERDWEEAIRLTDASKASVVVDPDAADAAAEREAFARDMQIGENQEADPDEIDENAMRDQMDGIVGAAIDEMGEQQQMGQDGEEGDYMGNIWDILRQEFLKAGQNVPIFVTELKKAVTSRGYNQQQFDTTLGFYEDMGVVEYTDATRNAVKAGGELE
ncbi:unnamed protein product [Amoebophrya sp. A25]|nr:unnamed protein product [Amoebophrya sp. A25]|eukprot:GSA25T00019575001.1